MTRLSGNWSRRCILNTSVFCISAVVTGIPMHAEDFPDQGVHWRTPVADERGEFLFAQGADVVMRASTVDLALVSKVEFSVDGGVVGTVTEPPYSYTWVASGSGVRTITATAFDGNQSLASVDQDIEVIGDVLVITPQLVDVAISGDTTTSFVLNIDNQTNISRNWAMQIQGGTAETGTAGDVAVSIAYDERFFGRSEIIFAIMGPKPRLTMSYGSRRAMVTAMTSADLASIRGKN